MGNCAGRTCTCKYSSESRCAPSRGSLGLALRSIETPRWGRLFSQSQLTWHFSVTLLRICDVLYDVLPHQAGRHETHAVAVHQLQQIPPSLIDEGHAC